MAIELTTHDWRVKLTGEESFDIPAGERLKIIETAEGGNVERLNAKVPNGKRWTALVIVDITESDE